MSAFIVSKVHLDALVTGAIEGFDGAERWSSMGAFTYHVPDGSWNGCVTRLTAQRVGQMLQDENLRSVSYRYPLREVTPVGVTTVLPGPRVPYYENPYVYKRYPAATMYLLAKGVSIPNTGRLLSVAALAKAIGCYDYQACEHPDYGASEAKAFVEAMRRQILRSLPGYNEAPWTIDA